MKPEKEKELKHLTVQDLKEGEEIRDLYNSLDEETKKQARIYLSALSDRCNFITRTA